MSKTQRIIQMREALITVFCDYLYVARGIEDLQSEDDFDDLKEVMDSVLEENL